MSEKQQAELYRSVIDDYREYLELRFSECIKQLERERASAVRAIENDNNPEYHRKNLIELRAEADTYGNALNALEGRLDEAMPRGNGK